MYILGKGSFAKSLHRNIFTVNSLLTFDGYISLDSDLPMLFKPNGEVKVFTYPEQAKFILGTTKMSWRKRFLAHFLEHYPSSVTYFPNVSATNVINDADSIGIGNVFMNNTIVDTNTQIGNFNILCNYSSISYSSSIGDNNFLAPYSNILNSSKIKDNNFLGSKACVSPNTYIGSNNIVSAGECLFDDMRDDEFFQSGIITDKR